MDFEATVAVASGWQVAAVSAIAALTVTLLAFHLHSRSTEHRLSRTSHPELESGQTVPQLEGKTDRELVEGPHAAAETEGSPAFSELIAQLYSGNSTLCLAAIERLEALAGDARVDHRAVMEALAAFIRKTLETLDGAPPPVRQAQSMAIRAAVKVVARRDTSKDFPSLELYLAGADLSGSRLSGADLHQADLSRADLSGADLERAILSKARLVEAILYQADLAGAYLAAADLTGAKLPLAALRGAILSRARLRHAVLPGAKLPGAILYEADLTGAHLAAADLTGADLTAATLCEAKLPGADLSRADLSGADLRGAWADSATLWPEEFDAVAARAAGVRLQWEGGV
jgi:hypothetical protein